MQNVSCVDSYLPQEVGIADHVGQDPHEDEPHEQCPNNQSHPTLRTHRHSLVIPTLGAGCGGGGVVGGTGPGTRTGVRSQGREGEVVGRRGGVHCLVEKHVYYRTEELVGAEGCVGGGICCGSHGGCCGVSLEG